MLKGEESYAKTTDTVLNVIEFEGDRTIQHYHVGCEVSVYRMEGENSSVVIYCNGEEKKVIPWAEEMSASVIQGDPSLSWDSQRGVVIWGADDEFDSGLLLDYDTDNQFYARFVGNSECLKSESKHYDSYVAFPSTFTATLTIDTQQHSHRYLRNETCTIIGTLLNGDGNPIANKRVKLYKNGSYATYMTTDFTGKVTVPQEYVSTVGLHNIRLVFEGDDTYFACEDSIEISIGGSIGIIRYDANCINGKGTVDARYIDWFGDPFVDTTVSIHSSQTIPSMSGVTDDDGKVTINMDFSSLPSPVTIPTLQLSANGDSSGIFKPVYATIDYMEIRPSLQPVIKGEVDTMTVYGRAYNNESVEVPLTNHKVSIPLCEPSEVTLDGNNEAITYYTADGSGQTVITATFSDTDSTTYTLDDVIQFAEARDTDSRNNLNWSVRSGSFIRATNGYQLKATSTTKSASIMFSDAQVSSSSVDYGFEFEVEEVISNFRELGVCETSGGGYYKVAIDSLAYGDVIRMEKQSHTITVYKNDTVVGTIPNSGYKMPMLQYVGSSNGGYILLDQFKWWLI